MRTFHTTIFLVAQTIRVSFEGERRLPLAIYSIICFLSWGSSWRLLSSSLGRLLSSSWRLLSSSLSRLLSSSLGRLLSSSWSSLVRSSWSRLLISSLSWVSGSWCGCLGCSCWGWRSWKRRYSGLTSVLDIIASSLVFEELDNFLMNFSTSLEKIVITGSLFEDKEQGVSDHWVCINSNKIVDVIFRPSFYEEVKIKLNEILTFSERWYFFVCLSFKCESTIRMEEILSCYQISVLQRRSWIWGYPWSWRVTHCSYWWTLWSCWSWAWSRWWWRSRLNSTYWSECWRSLSCSCRRLRRLWRVRWTWWNPDSRSQWRSNWGLGLAWYRCLNRSWWTWSRWLCLSSWNSNSWLQGKWSLSWSCLRWTGSWSWSWRNSTCWFEWWSCLRWSSSSDLSCWSQWSLSWSSLSSSPCYCWNYCPLCGLRSLTSLGVLSWSLLSSLRSCVSCCPCLGNFCSRF